MILVNVPIQVTCLLSFISVCLSVNAPELFGKDEKMDKLVIRNQVAYHFKKIVREVSQELFVSRKIDVSLLFQGNQVLKQTEQGVRKFCNKLPYAMMASSREEVHMAAYTYFPEPAYSSFTEARARCEAKGMQLPEVYTNLQAERLSKFLSDRGIAQCFAGIIPDPIDAIQRHIMTGFPLWRTGYEKLQKTNGEPVPLRSMLDDINAKFLYTAGKKLVVSLDNPSVINGGHFGSHTYRDSNKELSQIMAKVICEPRWDGESYDHFRSDSINLEDFKIKTRFSREQNSTKTEKTAEESSDFESLQDLCFSVANQAGESYKTMTSKLTDLLALVDITVHTEIGTVDGTRQKKAIFLAKFIFVTGVKLLWTLFGFMQKMKMSNRMKQLETALTVTQAKVDQNSNAIQNMTRLIYGNSVAIGQLNIRADDLDIRLTVVEGKVEHLLKSVGGIMYKMEVALTLLLIQSLLSRTTQSMDNGYDVLKDIIHCAKLGQTSPLVLPIDQMELVQNEVRKVSTAVLDPDFAKMQSIVISDPNDPSLLLVVVNVAALSRQNMELVKLIPVPYFEASGAFLPVLDYDTIVLDQLASTYSILDEQEEYDCLFSRCYVSSIERPISEKSCGIPQFFDRQLDSCMSESVMSTGVFLKPMLPDGVIFAFRKEVQSQLFCKDNNVIGNPRKISGTGILQLPNGCILSVTDDQGKITKVKGQPLYRMIDAEDISLMANGPLNTIHASVNMNGTQKVTTYDAFLEQRLSSFIKQVATVDDKIENQYTHIWSLTGLILVILLSAVVIVYSLYKYSGKFRTKIRALREGITELTQQVLHIEINSSGLPAANQPPPIPMKPVNVLLNRLRESKQKVLLAAVPNKDQQESTYIAMSDISIDSEGATRYEPPSSCFRPIGHLNDRLPNRCYPSITPLLNELKNAELSQLREEGEEVKALCQTSQGAIPKRLGL